MSCRLQTAPCTRSILPFSSLTACLSWAQVRVTPEKGAKSQPTSTTPDNFAAILKHLAVIGSRVMDLLAHGSKVSKIAKTSSTFSRPLWIVSPLIAGFTPVQELCLVLLHLDPIPLRSTSPLLSNCRPKRSLILPSLPLNVLDLSSRGTGEDARGASAGWRFWPQPSEHNRDTFLTLLSRS